MHTSSPPETGSRLDSHGPLSELDLPVDAYWRSERDASRRTNPSDWLRWDDAVATVRWRSEQAGERVNAYRRHLGASHPIVRYLEAHAA
jgi:formylglycine-generating enzyme required for sulfatase activity